MKKEYELPAFLFSVVAGDYVWFIPFQTNKIMYADKKTCQLHVFEADGENETKQSLLGRIALGSKYILEYVRENRYIGLFSDGVHREIFKSILSGQNGIGKEKPESNNGLKIYKEMLKL